MYCVTCKKQTKTKNISKKKTKNNRLILVGTCTTCGKNKSSFISIHGKGMDFVPTRQGLGFVNDLLNSGVLPEMHLPGHNYTGPGTKLKKRMLRGDKPVNKLDEKAMYHDMAYSIFKDKKDRHVFDKKLQDEAMKIMKESESVKEKLEAGLVGGIMAGKRKMGLGSDARKC